jgi:hypothetical protein
MKLRGTTFVDRMGLLTVYVAKKGFGLVVYAAVMIFLVLSESFCYYYPRIVSVAFLSPL